MSAFQALLNNLFHRNDHPSGEVVTGVDLVQAQLQSLSPRDLVDEDNGRAKVLLDQAFGPNHSADCQISLLQDFDRLSRFLSEKIEQASHATPHALDQAEFKFREIFVEIEHEPYLAMISLQLAQRYLEMERGDFALKLIESAQEMVNAKGSLGTRIAASFLRGMALEAIGDSDAACQQYETLAEKIDHRTRALVSSLFTTEEVLIRLEKFFESHQHFWGMRFVRKSIDYFQGWQAKASAT